MAFLDISHRTFTGFAGLDEVQEVPPVCRRGKQFGFFVLDVLRIFFALFYGFGLLGRAAVIWNVVVRPDAELQGAFLSVVGYSPRVVRFRIPAPIALRPDDLDIAIVEMGGLGVVDIYVRITVPHQNAAG